MTYYYSIPRKRHSHAEKPLHTLLAYDRTNKVIIEATHSFDTSSPKDAQHLIAEIENPIIIRGYADYTNPTWTMSELTWPERREIQTALKRDVRMSFMEWQKAFLAPQPRPTNDAADFSHMPLKLDGRDTHDGVIKGYQCMKTETALAL